MSLLPQDAADLVSVPPSIRKSLRVPDDPNDTERIIELLTQIRDLLQARKPGRKPKK